MGWNKGHAFIHLTYDNAQLYDTNWEQNNSVHKNCNHNTNQLARDETIKIIFKI